MATRQSELLRVLNELAAELPQPEWIALVDDNGLIMACVPSDPPVGAERISAMAAASVSLAERVLREIEGGKARFASLAGSRRQHLTVVLGPDRPVTGGYAKIATVVARDWPLLVQAPPGTAVRFRAAALAEVVEELRRTEDGRR